jgi:hypothetical protein
MPPILNVDRPAMINSFVSLLSNVPIFDNEHLWREVLQLAQVDDIDAALKQMQAHQQEYAPPAARATGQPIAVPGDTGAQGTAPVPPEQQPQAQPPMEDKTT